MIFLVAMIFKVNIAFATGFPTITVVGKIVSFDRETVVLSINGHRFPVPRNSISKKFKIQSGETVEAEIESPFKKKSTKATEK